jgi:hypothetical protein
MRTFQVWEAEQDGCFASAISTCLQVPVAAVPRPDFEQWDWLDVFHRELERMQGVRLQQALREQLPPHDLDERWVAILEMPTGGRHAVACMRAQILHDPNNGQLQGQIPWDWLVYGFRLRPAG